MSLIALVVVAQALFASNRLIDLCRFSVPNHSCFNRVAHPLAGQGQQDLPRVRCGLSVRHKQHQRLWGLANAHVCFLSRDVRVSDSDSAASLNHSKILAHLIQHGPCNEFILLS